MHVYNERHPRGLRPHKISWLLRLVPLIALLGLAGTGLAGCADAESQHSTAATTKVARAYTKEDVGQNKNVKLPAYVQPELRSVYQYVLNNPDQVQYIPCYCGCGLGAGHESNLNCYISGTDTSGNAIFTDHATYCDVCVQITLDTQRLSAEGKSLREIRDYVDQVHGPKGPPTKTQLPPL